VKDIFVRFVSMSIYIQAERGFSHKIDTDFCCFCLIRMEGMIKRSKVYLRYCEGRLLILFKRGTELNIDLEPSGISETCIK
jgi:hypothetical protein